MQINTTVQLDKGETLLYAPDAAAMQVLVALGGDAQTDFSRIYIAMAPEPGIAGVPPPPIEATP